MEIFSFNEHEQKRLAAKLCIVLCDTVSNKTTLVLEIGKVILPLERHTIFVNFAPTVDDTARTALPKEIRLALIHQNKYFFKEGFTLHVASSIPVLPGYISKAALLTLLSLEQTHKVPTRHLDDHVRDRTS